MADRIVIRCTSEQTAGEAVVVEAFLEAGGHERGLGDRLVQERRFEVVHGAVAFEVEGATTVVGAGERFVVPSGLAFCLWNAGHDEAQFVCEVRPALDFERRINSVFTSGRST